MRDLDLSLLRASTARAETRAATQRRPSALPMTSSDAKPVHSAFAQLVKAESGNPARIPVEKGDTLISMTKRFMRAQQQNPTDGEVYKLSMAVAKHNRLANPNLIHVGQVLDFSALSAASVANPNSEPSTSAVALPMSDPSPPAPTSPMAGVTAPQTSAPPQTTPMKLVVVGDSIAVGIGGALLKQSGVKPEFAEGRKFLQQVSDQYVVDATGGHSSPQILKKLSANPMVKHADVAILSVGTNDWVNSKVNAYYTPERITANLQKIRAEVNAKDHVWVLPYDEQAKALVLKVAQEHGDKTLDLEPFQKADRYHPRSYADIAKSLNQSLNSASLGAYRPAPTAGQEASNGSSSTWVSTQSALMSRPTPLVR
jgi:lysophospholipase L1-like esterase